MHATTWRFTAMAKRKESRNQGKGIEHSFILISNVYLRFNGER